MAGGLARFVRAVWRGPAVTPRRAGGASPSLDRATAESRSAGPCLLRRAAASWRERRGAGTCLLGRAATSWRERRGGGRCLLGRATASWRERRGAGPGLFGRAAATWRSFTTASRRSASRFFKRAAVIWRGPTPSAERVAPAAPALSADEPANSALLQALKEAVANPSPSSEAKVTWALLQLLIEKVESNGAGKAKVWKFDSRRFILKELNAVIVMYLGLKGKELFDKALERAYELIQEAGVIDEKEIEEDW